MWLCVVFLLVVLTPPVGAINPPIAGVSRPNYGVDFNFLFAVNNMHGTWKHIWTIDLNVLNRPLPLIPKIECPSNSATYQEICVEVQKFAIKSVNELWSLTKEFQEELSWAHNPQMLATFNRGTTTTVSRQKRALLPFVGDIEKFFFGLATESDVAALKKSLEDMEALHKRSIEETESLGGNLASLTKLVSGEIANSKAGFQLVKNTFQNFTAQINEKLRLIHEKEEKTSGDVYSLRNSVIQIWGVLSDFVSMLTTVNKVVIADSQLVQGVQTILSGYIPIALVHPTELMHGLEVALQGIRRTFPGASLSYPTSNIGYYYTHRIVTPIIHEDQLSLVVDIPVDLSQLILNAYAIRTYPVSLLPYNPYTRVIDEQSHAMRARSRLNLEIHNFLIDQEGNYYSTATDLELLTCKGELIKTCATQFPLYTIQKKQCIEHLWLDSPFEDILSTCPYKLDHVVHAAQAIPFVQVIPLNSGRWYIDAPLDDQWTIVCPTRAPEIRKPCTSCVIQVDCGCGIKNKWFEIPTRVSSCDNVFSPIQSNHTINPFSYLPKDSPWIINLTGSALPLESHQDPSLTLPDSGSWDNVMESMDQKSYDLNRLYLKQINETKMYRTEAEALLKKLHEQDQLISSIAGWPDWVVGISIFLTFGNSAALVFFCFCMIPRIRGLPFENTRYFKELEFVSSKESGILTIEVLILIIVIINTCLLIIVTGPALWTWILNRKWARRMMRATPRVKSVGYRKSRVGADLILVGTMEFGTDQISRSIPVIVMLANIPPGAHISELPPPESTVQVCAQDDNYLCTFPVPTTITHRFNVPMRANTFLIKQAKLHSELRVPSDNHLRQISAATVRLE